MGEIPALRAIEQFQHPQLSTPSPPTSTRGHTPNANVRQPHAPDGPHGEAPVSTARPAITTNTFSSSSTINCPLALHDATMPICHRRGGDVLCAAHAAHPRR